MYSLNVPNNKKVKFRVKSIKNSYVKKYVLHQQFLDVLETKMKTQICFRIFQPKKHTLRTVEINKHVSMRLTTSATFWKMAWALQYYT